MHRFFLIFCLFFGCFSFSHEKSKKKNYITQLKQGCMKWYEMKVTPYVHKIEKIIAVIFHNEDKENKINHTVNTRKQSPCDFTVEGNLYVYGGTTSKGPLQAKSLKVVDGITATGPIVLNRYGNYSTTLGSTTNGKSIYLFTDSQSGIYFEGEVISVKSATIGQPTKGMNVPLVVGPDGVLGTTYSTREAKTNILYFDKEELSLDALETFAPCYFQYKEEPHAPRQWGFIAEDFLGTPLSECVIYDQEGIVFTIDWQKINTAMVFFISRLYEKMLFMTEKMRTLEERISFLESVIAI